MNKGIFAGRLLLCIAAFTATITAIAHLSCIFLGPQCYAVQMAPEVIVESAQNGTILAPLGTVVVSAIFIAMGCYALSAANIIRKLPWLKPVVYTLAILCIIRGILPLQLWFRHADKVSEPVLYVGIVWLLVGLCYLLGFRYCNKS